MKYKFIAINFLLIIGIITFAGCSDSKNSLIGKWRNIDENTVEVIEFDKKTVTKLSVSFDSKESVLTGGGTAFDYSVADENIIYLLTPYGKMKTSISFPYENILKVVSDNIDFYIRWSDKSGDALRGIRYFRKTEYEKAIPLLKKAAKGNEIDAQYFLAMAYFQGKGVEKDKTSAIEWAKKSFAGNFEKATGLLGDIYNTTENGDPDYKNVIVAYEKAVELDKISKEQKIELLWIYAAGPEKYRNGEKAILLAKEFEEKDHFFWAGKYNRDRVLAAAYASAGDFVAADKYQKKFLKHLRYAKKPKRILIREKAMVVLESYYAEKLPYSITEEEKITKLVEQKRIEAAQKAARIKSLTKKATTPTNTLGSFIFTNKSWAFINETEILVTDVSIVTKRRRKRIKGKDWSTPVISKVYFNNMKGISSGIRLVKGQQNGKIVNLPYGELVVSTYKSPSFYSNFSEKDKVRQLADTLIPAVSNWQKIYPELVKNKITVKNDL